MNYVNDPASKISFVEALVSPTTSYSYFQFTEAKKYRVKLNMTHGTTTMGLSSHRLLFFDITANQNICDTIAATNGSTNTPTWNIEFEFIPTPGNAYTFVIVPSSVVVTSYSLVQFSLTIEEIIQPSLDRYYFNSGSLQSFKFENQSSGNVSVNLKNTVAEWRMWLDGPNLVFEKFNGLTWDNKSTLFG